MVILGLAHFAICLTANYKHKHKKSEAKRWCLEESRIIADERMNEFMDEFIHEFMDERRGCGEGEGTAMRAVEGGLERLPTL